MAEVKGYQRKTKTGQVIEVKDFKTSVEGAPEDPNNPMLGIVQPPDPMKELRELPGRPPILATPGQYPGGRMLPGHGAPIVDSAAVEAVGAEGETLREESDFENETLEDEADWKAEKEATAVGYQVESKSPKLHAAIQRLKKKGAKVKEPGLIKLAVEVVEGYTRTVNGKTVHVGGHARKGELGTGKLGGNKATRTDDKRTSQGQTRTNFLNELTGAPMGKTETGDTFEQLFIQKGKVLVEERYGQFELVTGAGEGTSRTTPLDLRTRTHGGELKSMSSSSNNLKTAIKKDEIDRKLHAVATEKLKPLLLVQVIDQKTRTVNLYGMETFGSKAVSKMEHFGEFTYSKADFKKAQAASGHDKKALTRAVALLTPEQKSAYAGHVAQGMTAEQALIAVRKNKQATYVQLSAAAVDLLDLAAIESVNGKPVHVGAYKRKGDLGPQGPSVAPGGNSAGDGAVQKFSVPPGGKLMRHKKVKSSYITVDVNGNPVNKISTSGTVTKAPANIKLSNYTEAEE